MEQVIKELYAKLEGRGFKAKVVSINHLHDLQGAIEDRHDHHLFDEQFYNESLTSFVFNPPSDLLDATSIIVVAVPCTQTRVAFTRNGRSFPLIIPPTYVDYAKIHGQVGTLLSEFVAEKGYHVSLATLPKKTLAVRSGLAEYGRNNICYVPGMGSFLLLVAFFSDLPAQDDNWYEPQMMKRCEACEACLRQCPTHAIAADRFLLHAERCIVFHNERSPEHAFPDWIDLAGHDCVIGCMYCQRCCPENKTLLKQIEGSEIFYDEETSLLLKGVTADQLPVETMKKLQRLELTGYIDVLPRNLSTYFGSD